MDADVISLKKSQQPLFPESEDIKEQLHFRLLQSIDTEGMLQTNISLQK